MPKSSSIQSSFNTGEASPLLYGRVDSPRYKDALATCLNYIPTLQGPLTRRPAFKYAVNVKDSNNPPVFVPFKYSATQAYMLEIGDFYMRFYANNGQVICSATTLQVHGIYGPSIMFYATRPDSTPFVGEGTLATDATLATNAILELKTPWAVADVPLLKFAQNADTLYFTHPNYPPQKLQRFSANSWTIKPLHFLDGPYLPNNSSYVNGDNTSVTLTPSATSGAVQIVTGPPYVVSGAANNGSGLIRITVTGTHTYVTGQSVHIEGVGGTTEANTGLGGSSPSSWKIIVITSSTFDLVGSAFVHAYASPGAVYPALFNGADGIGGNNNLVLNAGRPISLLYAGVRYFGTIIQDLNAAKTVMFVDSSVTLPGTSAATVWSLGVYSGNKQTTLGPVVPNPAVQVNGFPANVCFHQNRIVLSGCAAFPQQWDASQIGLYESFSINAPATLAVASINAIQFTLVSQDQNAIRWMKSNTQGLLAGTYECEWSITPSTQGEALTPTNVNAVQSSNYGSANIDAVQVGNAAIYVQRAQRKVREMNYFWQAGTFRSTDLSELSEHITSPGIIKLAVQKETQPIIWGIRSDGALVSLVYDREDTSLRAGWARHFLGGQSDAAGTPPIVLSMGVIPSPDASFDQLWIIVQRWLNGAKVVTIEYMTKIYNDAILQEDAFQGDCGATYDSPLSISGISHASPAVVTASAHGFSNGDQIRIVNVIGLNLSTTDTNGNVTISNLVNENTFVVAGVTTNTFQLNDFSGNAVSSLPYTTYVSGGQVRKMVLTISGLTWLENETVGVLADGALHPPITISNSGVATLNFRAAKVQIGYPFNSDGQMLRQESGAADGTAIGKTRRVSRVAVMLHQVGDFLMGMDFTRLIPVRFQRADQQQADQATPLWSGLHRDGVESKYDLEGQFCFRQNSMLPGVVQAITLMGEEFDL